MEQLTEEINEVVDYEYALNNHTISSEYRDFLKTLNFNEVSYGSFYNMPIYTSSNIPNKYYNFKLASAIIDAIVGTQPSITLENAYDKAVKLLYYIGDNWLYFINYVNLRTSVPSTQVLRAVGYESPSGIFTYTSYGVLNGDKELVSCFTIDKDKLLYLTFCKLSNLTFPLSLIEFRVKETFLVGSYSKTLDAGIARYYGINIITYDSTEALHQDMYKELNKAVIELPKTIYGFEEIDTKLSAEFKEFFTNFSDDVVDTILTEVERVSLPDPSFVQVS